MKYFIRGFLIGSLFFLSLFLYQTLKADESIDSEIKNIQSYYIQPCSSWSYSTDARGYVCTFTGMSINVPDAYDTDREIDNLIRQIDDLERRIQALENQQ